MTQATHQENRRGPLYAAIRAITVAFVILCPVAMIGCAVALTLTEGDWWLDLFLAYLCGIALIFFSLYVSLAVLLWELCRCFRRRAGLDRGDAPMKRMLHRILFPVSVAGVASVSVWVLIWYDLVSGVLAWIHLACGGMLILLLAVYGIYAIICRRADRRRTEAERLEAERLAWEGYLS